MPDSTTLIPIDPAPQTPETPAPAKPKRKRGAPKGNKNALKHGLYCSGDYLYNLNPLEQAELQDTKSVIEHFKGYIEHLYKVGIKTKDLTEVNITMRSYSAAVVALTRILQNQEQQRRVWLSGRYYDRKATNPHTALVKGLINDLKGIIDLDSLSHEIEEADNDYALDHQPAPVTQKDNDDDNDDDDDDDDDFLFNDGSDLDDDDPYDLGDEDED
jgi:hypothetical protein